MLSADVRFEGWTTETWTRFLSLWKPRATPDLEPSRPRGGVIAVHDGDRLRKLLHTRTGRLDPRGPWPVPLGELAEQHHASWALSARAGALDELMERLGARVERHDDLTAQALHIVTIVREMIQEGVLESWPRRLQGYPVPTSAVIHRALDAVCPEGRAMVLGTFRHGEVWTAIALRRGPRGIDVIAGPDELRPFMGVLSGDWRRDYRHLARAAEDRYAPLALGCFAEVDRFRELQVDPRPGAWGRAAIVRDVVVSPMPTAIRLALGADGARLAFESFRTLIGRTDAFGLLEPLMAGARKRLGSAAGDRDVSGLLGFDPLEALRALLRR
ncbi:MAG: hypothetical protein KC657_05005 [Myxococcales bacterium]|nr:hypothetical protein [Myxococcales bacterium]